MQKFIYRVSILCFLFSVCRAQTLSKETVVIETNYGTIRLKLFEETPGHKENFLRIAKEKILDSLLFHRVIAGFMIQGGDPKSRYASAEDSLGEGDLGYTVKPEFNPNLIHLTGRLCAARESDDINPAQNSSASQFYIVVGKKRTAEDMKKIEDRINNAYYLSCMREFLKSEQGAYLKLQYNQMKKQGLADSALVIEKRIETIARGIYKRKPEFHYRPKTLEAYANIGGTPHLDGKYTVFGEVVSGLEVVNEIALVPTGKKDRPLTDVRMRVYVEE
jgi:cyclophilin family peptidyl-prolyl cis-trans isomerase